MRRLDAAVIFEELATVDPSTSAFLTIHNMVTWFITSYGTDAVRAVGQGNDQRRQAGLVLPDRTG